MHATILVIEDNPELQVLETDLLELHGYVVHLAHGADGVEMARQTRPDLILLDLLLQDGVRGEAVYAGLHACAETAAIPVIVVSAASRAVHIGAELGAEATIQKPFDIQSLTSAIEDTLHNAAERQNNGKH